MNISMENISPNADKSFIYPLIEEVRKMMENFKITLTDAGVSFNEKAISKRAADKLKELYRTTTINKNIENICDILTKRFGIRFEMVVDFKGGGLAYVITPPLDYKTIGIALQDLDSLFPNKKLNSILWNTLATRDEKRIYDTLKSITDSLRKGTFKINTAKGYIEGLDDAVFVVHLDLLTATVNKLNPDEITAVLLHEVGHVFTYLEHLFYSTKNTLVLLDSFLFERFDKGRGDIEALTIALNDTGIRVKNKTVVGVLQGLDMFTLKTYGLDLKKGNMQIDFERQADQFVARLGLGDKLSSAIVKVSSLGTLQPIESESKDNIIVRITKSMFLLISAILTLLIFNVFILGILILWLGFKAISFLIGLIFRLIETLIRAIFGKKEQNYDYDDLVKRLRKIKLDLIRQIRKLDSKDALSRKLLTDQIDAVNYSIDLIKERFSIVKKYGDSLDNLNTSDHTEMVNEMLEILEENDNYYFAEKFKNLLDNKRS